MPILSVGANNQQHDGGRGLNPYRTEDVPTRFSRLVYTIQTHQAAFVFEDQSR
jgi:hypothetical protein